MKRIALFLLTNILVVLTISILLQVLGVGNYVTSQGLNYTDLMVFCLLWGMTGSLFSLAISRISAKMMMGIQVIDRNSPELGWVYSMVEDLSRKAGLPTTPEVGIYQSPEVNAFATGPTKRRALVAFSTGLLNSMNRNEVEGVAGHEIAHIANGDMVTMTLLQGVINAFVMFFARVIAWAISQNSRD
jgi:heat shock protein HtpX